MSDKFSLDRGDVKRLVFNFAVYNVPLWMLTFVTAVSQNIGYRAAAVTASVTFLSALVDAARKFVNGDVNCDRNGGGDRNVERNEHD
ncbi:hypothetical protein FACS1894120_5710 [Clostridia bacterium]|nr:hypothetical protein FACS1894120_5710 [Clostridia bacterium]